ncbi:MAG: amidohydrolase family protein [Polyangiaceae bacterium]
MSRSPFSRPTLACALLSLSLAGVAAAQPRPAVAPAGRPAVAPAGGPAVATAPIAQKTIAIRGAKVYTGEGDPLEDAVILITGDEIKSVGKSLATPPGAEVIDAKGQIITPGLVDPLTHAGLTEVELEPTANDETESPSKDRIRAAYRAADAYNPESTVLPVCRTGGLTSVGVVPSGGLISGQSAWADLLPGTATDALAAAPLALHVHLETGADPQGGSRGAAVRAVREAFDDARTFQKNRAAWERNQSRPFSASRLDLDALALALPGANKASPRIPVVFHADKASTLLTALSIAAEFGLTPVIAGGAEAWRIRSTLAKSKVPVIVNPLLPGPDSFDMLGARPDNAALLVAAGVPVSLTTGETHNARKLRQAAGNAVRAGLPHTAAIAAITRAPAEALGMSAKYGTLTPGKKANLALWSADPLELSTRLVALYIHGKKQSLTTRQTLLLQKYRGITR